MASSHTLQAAIRFAWNVCVPAGGKCTWDAFFAMARKLYLAITLRANGVVNPADALQAPPAAKRGSELLSLAMRAASVMGSRAASVSK